MKPLAPLIAALLTIAAVASVVVGASTADIPHVKPPPTPEGLSFITKAQILPQHRVVEYEYLSWPNGRMVYRLENPQGMEWSEPVCENCGEWPQAIIRTRDFEGRRIITKIEPYYDECPYCCCCE